MKNGLRVGMLALALAGVYYYYAADIPRSLLSDEVGADGLPRIYAIALGLLGLLSIGQWFVTRARATEAGAETETTALLQHARAVGLLVLGATYLLLIGSLGYFLTIALLIAAVARYSGAAFDLRLLWISAGGAIVFWLVFVQLFGMPLPTGALWHWISG